MNRIDTTDELQQNYKNKELYLCCFLPNENLYKRVDNIPATKVLVVDNNNLTMTFKFIGKSGKLLKKEITIDKTEGNSRLHNQLNYLLLYKTKEEAEEVYRKKQAEYAKDLFKLTIDKLKQYKIDYDIKDLINE